MYLGLRLILTLTLNRIDRYVYVSICVCVCGIYLYIYIRVYRYQRYVFICVCVCMCVCDLHLHTRIHITTASLISLQDGTRRSPPPSPVSSRGSCSPHTHWRCSTIPEGRGPPTLRRLQRWRAARYRGEARGQSVARRGRGAWAVQGRARVGVGRPRQSAKCRSGSSAEDAGGG